MVSKTKTLSALIFLALLLFVFKSYGQEIVDRGPARQAFSPENPYKSFSTNFPARPAASSLYLTSAREREGWQPYGSFHFATVYDSNLFNSRIDPNDDLAYLYVVTVGLARKSDSSYGEIFYDLGYADYTENETLSRFSHSIHTRGGWQGDRWKIAFENTLKPDSPYNVGERTEFRLLEVSGITATSDAARVNISYELAPQWRLSYTQRYAIYYYHHEIDEPFSAQALTSNPRITYEITPEAVLYLSYSYRAVDYFKNGDFSSDQHTPRAGFLWRVRPSTEISVNVGYLFRTYDDLENEDHDGLTFKAEVSQRISRRLDLKVWTMRNLDENLDTSAAPSPNEDAYFFGTKLAWRASAVLELDAGATAGFTSREGFATMTDPENPALSFTRELENDFYGWDAGFKWKPNLNWTVMLGYKFFSKNSSFKNFEYDDHKVIGSVSVNF